MFDSFSHLASSESQWRHTLVGWTGEIENIQDPTGIVPVNKAAAPIPLRTSVKPNQASHSSDLRIPRQDRKRLKKHLEEELGGRVEPVWLGDMSDDNDKIVLRRQDRWRQYGERELFTLFHYQQKLLPGEHASLQAWTDYEQMNEAFADAIEAVYRPGDLVLVHDYQLLLLPKMLRERIPTMYIGFFLHTPFPSSELYRSLSSRYQLLHGVLAADMMGFQTSDYAQHFVSSCERILDANSSLAGINHENAYTAIEALPIGIDAIRTAEDAFRSEGVEAKMLELRRKYNGKKIIVGRDRLDSIRGVSQKLQAFEKFLENYPQWRDKVVLIQVTNPTSTVDRDEHSKTERKISDLRARINGKYGHLGYDPVEYYSQYLGKEEYFALLRIADLGLITSVRDGMNTTALEYVICQHEEHSPLIISESSGTASMFSNNDAIHVNPWDLKGVADAIERALTMPQAERRRSHQGLFRSVTENTVQNWTEQYIMRLLVNLSSSPSRSTPELDCAKLVEQYRKSCKRLFMFDYDGTLTPIVETPEAAIPTDSVTGTIETLASDSRNAVWIISGRDQAFLETHFRGIPALGLSAEHGAFIRMPHSAKWQSLAEQHDMSWQKDVWQLFEKYEKITPGSFPERKKIALTWHYRRASPEIGRLHATRLRSELLALMKDWEVDVMEGKANLEVRPSFINKGEIAKKLVKAYGHLAPDLILCLGDDFTDEGELINHLTHTTIRAIPC